MAQPINTSPRFLRLPSVQARTGLSRSCLYKKIALGEFPPSIRLGARAVGWVEADIDAWITDRIKISHLALPQARG